jgi:hypothetical protein
MINNKYLIIIFIILLIIILLFIFNYLLKDNKKDNSVYDITKFVQNKNIENFVQSSKTKSIEKSVNNLIKNGDFENAKDILNHVNQNGYNKIIIKKNPGLTSYVLEQKKTDNLTYYELACDNDKNSKYILYFWFSVSDKSPIEELDLEKLIKVKIQNEDFSNFIPRLNYNIVQKVIMSNKEDPWYLIKYDFISGNNTGKKMQLYLNYSEKLDYDAYYFTNIALYRVLIDAENFIYNNNLISYQDSYHYESNSPTWHDLSGNGNDMFWSNIPMADYTKGSLNTLNMKLTGFPANKIANDKFSILICLNKNFENNASDDAVNEEDSTSKFYLISVPGNERYSFEIEIKDNYLYLISGTNTYKSKHEFTIYNKSLLAIVYDDETMNIYLDGLNIIHENIKKVYFSSDTVMINRNKNLDYNFYSVLFYNRAILKNELNDIREYFITNQNKNFNEPDINNYHMNQNAEYSINNTDNLLFKPSSKNMNEMYNNINFNNDVFVDKFDNQNNIVNNENSGVEACSSDCLKLCTSFIKTNNIDKYNDCINNCKNVLLSCKNFCDDSTNKDSPYCNNKSLVNTEDKEFGCPQVYKKNGNYIVYVAPNSKFSKLLNYSGEKSYGNNLEKARYTYNTNFPQCPTPVELMPGEGKNYLDTCPYIINNANPCYTLDCAGVNWNVKNYKELNLNKNCKKSVSNYCQINYNIDDYCYAWNPKNRDDPNAIEMRRYFEDPNDYCSPSQFKIEEHPDFNKYIKKDNIPCWGCNLGM